MIETKPEKRIRDPLYGFIRVDTKDLTLIDHKIVQRLRWVSQLPLEQLVYPSAQHSRFEHSLGVMHLAGIAAKSLIRNSNERFQEACESTPSFNTLNSDERVDLFVRSARWSGLLHDLGHAPFSHTFEQACNFSAYEIDYDHEYYGFLLARQILEEIGKEESIVSALVLRVLNKSIAFSDLDPSEMLLRRIIDSALDVDKGDYLLRDSYHCGVNYGNYDRDFLWENVAVTENFQIGVRPKAALEAWSLTLARHKMHQYVYQHHVRTITDALLVEIINLAFDKIASGQILRDILPFQSSDDVRISEHILKFIHWTDNSLLKCISAINDSSINARIESFSNRKLYKRGFQENLVLYPNSIGNEKEIMEKLTDLRKEMCGNGIEWNAIPLQEMVVPVYNKHVQQDILVQNENEEVPVAKYLGFGVEEDSIVGKGDLYLHIFIQPSSLCYKEKIKRKIVSILKDYCA